MPYLAPEVQLFYKARQLRPKDEEDFTAVLPLLARDGRDWLARAISLAYGPQNRSRTEVSHRLHPWLARLEHAGDR